MSATDTRKIDQSEDNSTLSIGRKVANNYYRTTASRGHNSSLEYYESCSKGLLRSLRPWLPVDKGARCLDLACGCGEFLYLLEKLGFEQTSGVDLCEDELRHAAGYVKGNLTRADVLNFLRNTKSQSYDFVSALNLLEHLPKEELLAVLIECRRILRPGGTLVAMVPNALSPFGTVTRYWDISHEWAFTPNNFEQLAALAGFDSHIDIRECGPRVHGLISGLRYLLWQMLRAGIAMWLLIEVGTRRGRAYTMDMLVRLSVPK